MIIDKFGIPHCSEEDICNLLYEQPDANLQDLRVDSPEEFNKAVKDLFYDTPILQKYNALDIPVEEFDAINQSNWLMPQEYKDLDIAKWVLAQCNSEAELQRVGIELLMFQERELFDLLRFMKYMVDVFRKNNLVWGVGRGSSVSSHVLFLIGVHKIDSLFFDLDVNEFLK